MATAQRNEPWTALLDLAREDGRLVHEDAVAARRPQLVDIPQEVSPLTRDALQKAGIEMLYSHQAEALFAAFSDPTIVTTGTASGKSLCFQLPTLEVLTSDSRARAMYLYPTKALAQDQARSITRFGLTKHIRPAIYDGDTPRAERSAIRKRSNLIITNPDMLHVGILPHHPSWGEVLS